MARQRAEARVEPVDRLAAGQHPIDDLAGGADAYQRRLVELDPHPSARHRQHVIDGEAVATEFNALGC